MEPSKALSELAEVVNGHVIGTPETPITDVTHDSRQARHGTLFVAVRGATHDGHDFVEQALSRGAAALCVERPVVIDIPQLVVGDSRGILGRLAAEVHGNPSHDLDVIGVTGTNGKTTVTRFVESILSRSGYSTGLIGTIGSRVLGADTPSVRTTPEASDFQRLLASMLGQGVTKVAVEVSSHALELGRVAATRFAVAAFTNLSQDHLDFHSSMEAYKAAKMRLFTEYEVGTAVFNIDDPVGSDLAETYAGSHLTVGSLGDFSASDFEPTANGTRFHLDFPGGTGVVDAPVYGEFNVSNLLMAVASCYAAGTEVNEVMQQLEHIETVPGRFEVVSTGGEPMVVVDYAHTPDGVSMAVNTAHEISKGRVIVLIGAGGDRDQAKRRLMGEAASAGDLVVVTSDNPRSEDPELIIDQVLAGVATDSIRQPDRETAIKTAISVADPGDIVLILGKGHEQGQEKDGVVVPFDDREVALDHLNLLRKSTNFESDSGSMGQ